MYLRNQNIRDESFNKKYKKRAECEKIHRHIQGIVIFDIRRVIKLSRKLILSLELRSVSTIAANRIAK
jgi:hypothetical protein